MLSNEKKELLKLYNEGLAAYKQRKWQAAAESFKSALKVDPKDGPSVLYLQRVKEYMKNPPPEDWDGAFVMTTK
ncbi:MAG: tetratricopeptide repeat protein [Spirochaetia bacterium]|jgi:Tfp pilus assembly protein PilF|nr:tetratricopeptide repeat protein [Spirochaetia bacterium]